MTIGLVGAGNMASALARGWGKPVFATDSGSGRARTLVNELGGEVLTTNKELTGKAELVVLCHKPRQLSAIAPELQDANIVVSVLGGISTQQLQNAFPKANVFRLMPNTAVEVRQGVTLYVPADQVDLDIETRIVELFEQLGTVVRIPESQIETATGVSGVGPAYVSLIVEAQVDAAVKQGLPAKLAGELTVKTLSGSAALLEKYGLDTLSMRRGVTSPGGITARGLAALEAGGIRSAFSNALQDILKESK
jgi:pyrroline-5-carboxylate reductase